MFNVQSSPEPQLVELVWPDTYAASDSALLKHNHIWYLIINKLNVYLDEMAKLRQYCMYLS